jgi:hypothetical protein
MGKLFTPKKYEWITYCKKCYKEKEDCKCGTTTQPTNGKEQTRKKTKR